VAGVTMNQVHIARSNNRLAAVKRTRSAATSDGRLVVRRTTASSWRSPTISNSLNSRERNRRTTSCITRRSAT
jgi:hypothetical protein